MPCKTEYGVGGRVPEGWEGWGGGGRERKVLPSTARKNLTEYFN